MQHTELPPNLTVREAAAYLGVSKPTIDRRISSGELKSYKNGRLRKIRKVDLLEYENRLVESGMKGVATK